MEGSPSETRGELLRLLREQASRRRPADLLAQYRRDGYVMPSMLDQRLVNTLDRLAMDAAEGFDAVLLSPVAPLGSNSVVAPTSQDRTLSTTRGTEVVSDPTNVLALECALRLLAASQATPGSAAPTPAVRLATVHQTLRMQGVSNPDGAHSQHFRLFALGESGAGLPDDEFEVQAVGDQLQVYDRLFDACERSLRVAFPHRQAIVRFDERGQALAERVMRRLREALPHVVVATEPLTSSYYDGLRVGFGAEGRSGEFLEIADLGRFDWVAQLTSDRRNRFVASGFGIQLVPLLF